MKIAVVGAGIAGLTCAYMLQKQGFSVTVFEAENTVGGRMRSRKKDGMIFDIGATHLADHYTHMKELVDELDLKWQSMLFQQYGLFRNGKLTKAFTYKSIWTNLRLALLFKNINHSEIDLCNLTTAEQYDDSDTDSVFRRMTNNFITDYYFDAITSSYQFHRCSEISRGVSLAILQSLKYNSNGWLLHRIPGGMQALPDALAKELTIHRQTPVNIIKAHNNKVFISTDQTEYLFDLCVLATPAPITKEILLDQTPEQNHLLENTSYAATISMAFSIPKNSFPKYSVSWIPYKENQKIASISNESMKGNEVINQDRQLLCLWLHEDYAKTLLNESNESNENIYTDVRNELLKLYPFISHDEIYFHDLQKWTHAMPKFKAGHLKRVTDFLTNGQGQNNIYFAGDYLNSLWTEGALRCGKRVANQIIAATHARTDDGGDA